MRISLQCSLSWLTILSMRVACAPGIDFGADWGCFYEEELQLVHCHLNLNLCITFVCGMCRCVWSIYQPILSSPASSSVLEKELLLYARVSGSSYQDPHVADFHSSYAWMWIADMHRASRWSVKRVFCMWHSKEIPFESTMRQRAWIAFASMNDSALSALTAAALCRKSVHYDTMMSPLKTAQPFASCHWLRDISTPLTTERIGSNQLGSFFRKATRWAECLHALACCISFIKCSKCVFLVTFEFS